MLRKPLSTTQVSKIIEGWYALTNQYPEERVTKIATLDEIEIKVYMSVATHMAETHTWLKLGERENLRYILIELTQQEKLLTKQSAEAKDDPILQLRAELSSLRLQVTQLTEKMKEIERMNQAPPAYQEPGEGNKVYSPSNAHPMFASSAAVVPKPFVSQTENQTKNPTQKFGSHG